jgi:hypothetical protein
MTTKTVDPRLTWWWWWDVQTRLTKWAYALLKGRKYTIHLSPEGTGYHDSAHHVIQANPQLFKERKPDTQFTATQGILAHEIGHAFFTDAWPDQHAPRLVELSNILEDERIERAISTYYPGVAPAIRLLGNLMLAGVTPVSRRDPGNFQAYACTLYWRWAYRRVDEERFLTKLQVNADGCTLWKEIRPLVEESWQAPNTAAVIELAQRILAILRISEEASPSGIPGVSMSGIPQERSDEDGKAMPVPTEASDGTQPGLGQRVPGKNDNEKCREEHEASQDTFSRPAPYVELETRARPLANQLVDALKIPQPETRFEPHDWQGRYSFRQELRTPETPNLARQGVDRTPRSLVLEVLVDRSGSMGPLNDDVRLSLMTLYLAATDLVIPTGIIYFGSAFRDEAPDKVMEVARLSPVASEEAKALIAGYEGDTGAEFLDWGLCLAQKALFSSPEQKKVIVVIHDGEPVYNGKDGVDWNLSLDHLKKLEKRGAIIIGVYLGNDPDHENKLKRLFSRLVVCTGKQLPEKLGNLLRSLA